MKFYFSIILAFIMDFFHFGYVALTDNRGEIDLNRPSTRQQLNPSRTYLRLGYDMATGKQIHGLTRFINHRGPVANLMPNVRLKSVPTNDQLNNVVTPIAPGQPEGIAWTWFDTQTYTSTTTTQIDFFQAIQTDKTLGNIQAQGQMPNPMFFQLYHIMVYIDIGPSGLAVAATIGTPLLGALNDVRNLINGSLTLNIAQKDYYQSKISMNPGGIGVGSAQLANAGTYTATDGDQIQYGNNGAADIRARNCFWGLIVIPPTQNFYVRMNWSAALTLNNGNTPIVCALDGYLFRRVL